MAGRGRRGETPVVERPGERQSMSAASAVNSKGAFWFATFDGALSGELFVELLKKLMFNRKKAVHLIGPARNRAGNVKSTCPAYRRRIASA